MCYLCKERIEEYSFGMFCEVLVELFSIVLLGKIGNYRL